MSSTAMTKEISTLTYEEQVNLLSLIFVLIILARNSKVRKQLKENTQFIGEIVNVQEKERKRISQELHDTVSQNIKVLLMWKKKLLKEKIFGSSPNMTELSNQNITKQTSQNVAIKNNVESNMSFSHLMRESSDLQTLIQKIISLEKQNQKELRRIIQNLALPELEDVPFKSLIESLCEEFHSQSGIECTFFVSDDVDLEKFSKDERHHILRIIQEALNNAKNHAHPSETSVIFQKKQNKIILMIFDDGEGFDISKNQDEKHFGMSGMEMRAKLLGGNLTIKSNRETRTQVHLEMAER